MARAFNDVTDRIIEFLSPIEEFQKKLFTMKKKIVECEYCLTIDNINEQYYPEILANQAQVTEWENLFCEKVQSFEDLKAQPTLVLDTKFFKQADGSNAFKDNVLSEIDLLDEKTNGLLINSENYQAIKFLQNKYRRKISTIYIDPPYNSPSSSIVYKNYFKHSSWATLMFNRLSEAKGLLDEKGCQIIAIDENEQNNLYSFNQQIFPPSLYDNSLIAVEHNKKGIQGDHFSYSSEFVVFSIPYSLKKINSIQLDEENWEWSNFRNWGGESLRTDAKNCFYPVTVNKNLEIINFGEVCDDTFHPPSANIKDGDNTHIYPNDSEDVERKWRYANDTVKAIKNRLKVEIDSNGILQIKIAKVSRPFKTSWYDTRYNAGDYGTKLLTSLGFKKGEFDFPKSIHLVFDCLYLNDQTSNIVIDYFAGSGTTGHAVIKMNKLEPELGNRKYILTEMGKYFNSVTKVRMQKVIYSENWKGGKPTDNDGSKNHIFKYMVLEQYEDVLDAIEQFEGETPKNLPLKYLYKPELKQLESSLDLSKPFSNQVKYGQPTKVGLVDLVETYNYLQGYEIKTIKPYNINDKYYKVVETKDGTLVIWRDITLAEDDSEPVKTIIGRYPDASRVDINFDFNILATLKDKQLPVGERVLDLTVIHAQVFSE